MTAAKKPIEVITPPNMLKVKVGGSLPKLDAEAIARAEQALKSLSTQFEGWMRDELNKLESAWADARENGLSSDKGAVLFRCAHDLKGLGTTYEYPLVTRLATSLCKLIETETRRAKAPKALVEALVEAIRSAVRDGVRTDEDAIGRALAEESEAIVARFLEALGE